MLTFTTSYKTPVRDVNLATFESRLLHVRNLIDFFEQEAREQDDILASHYGFSVSRLPLEEKYRNRLNKDLAHLTYERTCRIPPDTDWPYREVILPVLERCLLFIEHILKTPKYANTKLDNWRELLADTSKIVDKISSR